MKPTVLFFLLLLNCFPGFSQNETDADSVQLLQEVILRAYENNRKLIEVPAAVSVVNKAQLNRFNNLTILPALNSNPGVKMEERSPGSYRMNIRGSSLRSPFGVRNVKIYYDEIPYTDPSGFSAFNHIGFYNIQSIEVIKGPGSSLYGAGTGGVLLIKTAQANWKRGLSVDYGMGSFNLKNMNANLRLGSADFQNTLNYQQQSSDGYRNHTELDRKVFTWDAAVTVTEKAKLVTHFFYSDLFYETPGALTLNEYNTNPKAARPAAGPTPGAEQAKAAVISKTFLAGFSYVQQFNEHWQNTTSLYGAFTRLRNPTTRNYGRTSEPHTGGRSVLQYKNNFGGSTFTALAGTELQQGFSSVRIYANKQGDPDTLQTDDEVNNRQLSLFAQLMLELPQGWVITGGVSLNRLKTELSRLSTIPPVTHTKKFDNEIAPRLAVLKKITPSISAYTSIAKGFSPPTSAELLPSSGIVATDLEAERGINYEAGLRGSIFKNTLYFDINLFNFRLKNAIVTRRDVTGGDYFVNAGSAKQDGLETFLSYQVLKNTNRVINDVKIWISHTWHDFHYTDFKQINNDFSGKKLPSVAPHVVSTGLDASTSIGIYTNITYYYSDPIPLNDANTDVASSFNLLGARLGFRKTFSDHFQSDIFLTADNIFDVKYSLGNDINAFGGRYYNAAPGVNYFGGISIKYTMN